MKYQKLGTSDLDVSIVCLGTMTYGKQNTEEEAFEQMDYFLGTGGNFIDTAELYPVPPSEDVVGRTEEIIGRWFAARNNRGRVILATKVAGGGPDTRNFVAANRTVPKSPDAPNTRLTSEQIKAAVDGSLRRLQTMYIDLIQLHWPDRYTPNFGRNQFDVQKVGTFDGVSFDEQVQAIGELIKEGKVRHWGLSNETPYGICQFMEASKRLGVPPPISIQNDFSLLDRRFEGHNAEACYYTGIRLLPYGPLAGGTLTDKFHFGNEADPKSRHVQFPNFQPRYHAPRSMGAAAEYAALAKKHGLTTAQLALAWCASRWFVGSTIIGATTMDQLKENISAFDVELSEEVLAAIDEIHLERRNPNAMD